MHHSECVALKKGDKAIRGLRMVLRLLRARQLNPDGYQRRVRQLQTHVDSKIELARFARMARSMAPSLGALVPDAMPSSLEDLVQLICIIHTNMHGISNLSGQLLGSGLYPEASMFNHSCAPNCIISFVGNRAQIHTIRKVENGEELQIAYTELYASGPERRAKLRKSKYFDCSCTRCAGPAGEFENANLNTWISSSPGASAASASQVTMMKTWRAECARAMEQHGRDEHTLSAAEVLRETLEEASPHLHPHHVVMQEIRQALIFVLMNTEAAGRTPHAETGLAEVAALAGACAEALAAEVFPHHPSVALFLKHRAEALQKGGGDEKEAMATLEAARVCLSICYGQDHPDVITLNSCLRATNRCNRLSPRNR